MAASRFTSLSEENITQLLNDKDIRNSSTAVELAAALRKFYAEARKKNGGYEICENKAHFLL